MVDNEVRRPDDPLSTQETRRVLADLTRELSELLEQVRDELGLGPHEGGGV
jgi:hypothetical protein